MQNCTYVIKSSNVIEKQNMAISTQSKPVLTTTSDGHKLWYQNGQLHRLDGPAVEYADGTKSWYQNDNLHRLDGPAVEYADGGKFWYQNDKLHRLDGPAIEHADGTKTWYQNGKEYTFDDWLDKAPMPGEEKVMFKLEYA